MTWSLLGGFFVAVLLGAMVPGPTAALVIRRAAVNGTRGTLPVIAGMEIGLYAWVIATGFGLTALVSASEIGYRALRIAGSIVLITLGVQAWLASRRTGDGASFDETAPTAPKWWKQSLSGVVTNLLNPKIAVFAFAFFPQFIPPGANVLTTTLLLGVVQAVIDTGWYLVLATFVGRARKFFAKAKVRRRLERVTGTVLIGLGASLALERL
jgi:threonine/homoserine/homoserine lactone efflux protein